MECHSSAFSVGWSVSSVQKLIAGRGTQLNWTSLRQLLVLFGNKYVSIIALGWQVTGTNFFQSIPISSKTVVWLIGWEVFFKEWHVHDRPPLQKVREGVRVTMWTQRQCSLRDIWDDMTVDTSTIIIVTFIALCRCMVRIVPMDTNDVVRVIHSFIHSFVHSLRRFI